ncbi:hypothetical protein K490DRAFT_18159 [Neofusicoccum parvum]|uniref:Uncharacterized protein n=1 Tax=Neofusicoccum parvum TaxID=310453 RepID=A0ACB5RPM1_9PEZI|nr:hypothetical protein K490DRAFT_18159 [Neofusicoccum parvum]
MDSGHTPNYVDPPTRAGLLFAFLVPFAVLMTLTIGARFYIRGIIRRVLGWDDWIMLLAWGFTLCTTVLVLYMTKFGYGRHTRDVDPKLIPEIMKLNTAFERTVYPSMSLNKISVCLTYLRVFSHVNSNKWFCWMAILYSTCYCICIVSIQAANAALCPESTAWGQGENKTFCINRGDLVIAAAALNSFSDFVVFLWPARYLWDIQLPKERRLGLIGLFCIGCLICIAGIVRIWYFTVWFDADDKFWDGVWIFILPVSETNLGIVCGCLPACRPILVKLFHPLLRWKEARARRGQVEIVDGGSKSREEREREARGWWTSLEGDTTLKEDEVAITMRTLDENGRVDEEAGAFPIQRELSTTSTVDAEEIVPADRVGTA